jgi:acetyl esterase
MGKTNGKIGKSARRTKDPVLEPAARKFAEATSKPPFLYELPPEEGRRTVDEVQSGDVDKPAAEITDLVVQGGPTGRVPVRIIRPVGVRGVLPTILFTHGAGWVFGGPAAYDRLVRELAVGAKAAVVFPDYDRSPESRYPVAIEQCWTVAQWIAESGAEHDLDPRALAVAGDSAGGNMAIALTLHAKERGGVRFAAQVLFYPVTDANFDTRSYEQFASGYFLTRQAMRWFWDQYTTDPAERAQITASPLRARVADLTDLPPALVITGEADVLRDEGEAYADRLREAGVAVTAVRYGGIIHDFVMLDPLRETHAASAAIAQAIGFLSQALYAR